MMPAKERNPNFILKEPSLVKKLHKTLKKQRLQSFWKTWKKDYLLSFSKWKQIDHHYPKTPATKKGTAGCRRC